MGRKPTPNKQAVNLTADDRYQKIQEFKLESRRFQDENLQRKLSRNHEINKRPQRKVVRDPKKTIDKNNPMYKIILNAQKKNNELKKAAYKTVDSNYIDINHMTVADRVKIIKLAKQKNNKIYQQLLMEKSTTGLSELARQRKRKLMAANMKNWKTKKK
ncbi:hypothetical protein P344_01670 [Spiroplasma mirum ATCC 29335]|uniref:Uncharacterized protein n=1 Tax=Spiroplasma mirum ATCC 29335 TaxID=838561 RepID=W0GQ26_9MOLU|nr:MULTISPECIES: hypothetical protein [Spiroplasma]AHF60724.1 hypothetical protein SMM_0273 [Spiroplasma mirum ATCC 29335]AHI57696.1 hypothetical protein P344_01670 [Spiroplasma mirum ATCC 29335]AKM52842.1 hypothetical protein SATRI_v1c03150 [Spiroplasma atrichopogonis]